ncbi:MAG TPA: transposase [Pseudonocardiaceae bacterium]|nr:transposase [Pseudonocardiaceae bacterium]
MKITRIVHRRLRYRRRGDCPGPRTVIAPVAPHPIRKGRFTAAFLARLLYQKYVLGLPVHRITRALAADGLDVAQGSVTGALKAVADLLVPVQEALVARNAHAVHVHADQTSWRVFAQIEGKDGHRWWLWVLIAQDTVVFWMDPTRSATVLPTPLRSRPRRRCIGPGPAPAAVDRLLHRLPIAGPDGRRRPAVVLGAPPPVLPPRR